jgi:hypothetical protein
LSQERRLDHFFLRSTGPVRDPERIVDQLLAGLGASGFANVKGFAIGAMQLNGNAILTLKRAAGYLPS